MLDLSKLEQQAREALDFLKNGCDCIVCRHQGRFAQAVLDLAAELRQARRKLRRAHDALVLIRGPYSDINRRELAVAALGKIDAIAEAEHEEVQD